MYMCNLILCVCVPTNVMWNKSEFKASIIIIHEVSPVYYNYRVMQPAVKLSVTRGCRSEKLVCISTMSCMHA